MGELVSVLEPVLNGSVIPANDLMMSIHDGTVDVSAGNSCGTMYVEVPIVVVAGTMMTGVVDVGVVDVGVRGMVGVRGIVGVTGVTGVTGVGW